MSDSLGRDLVAQYVHGKLPSRAMSLDLFCAMVEAYHPADDPGRALRAASRAMTQAMAKGGNPMMRGMAGRIAQGLREQPVDPLIAKGLTALEDYIGDDRKEAVAHWIGLLAMGMA